MSVKIIKRKYKNQFNENIGLLNLSGVEKNFDWLIGNVGDWQRLELTFEAFVDLIASSDNTITWDSRFKTLRINSNKSWNDYGFDIGDNVELTYTEISSTDSVNFTYTDRILNFQILDLIKDTIEIDIDLNLQYTLLPTDRGNRGIKNVVFKSDKEVEGVKFQYTHLDNENKDSQSMKSFLDGTTTEFVFDGLKDLFGKKAMIPSGYQSGMAVENCWVERAGSISQSEFKYKANSNKVKTYEIGTVDKFRFSAIPLYFPEEEVFSGNYETQTFSNLVWELEDGVFNGSVSDCFIQGAGQDTKEYVRIMTKFKLTEKFNLNNDTGKFKVQIIGFKRGEVSSKVVVKEFVAKNIIGQRIVVDETIGFDVKLSHSYMVAITLEGKSGNFITTMAVKCRVEETKIEVMNSNNSSEIFKITCDYMMHHLFEDVDDFVEGIVPKVLYDDNSMTDNFSIRVYPEWNNPNTVIKNDLEKTAQIGNTGWFNENYNGLENKFKIDSFRLLNSDRVEVDEVDFGKPTIVEVEISGVKNLTSKTVFGFGFAWLPDNEEDFKVLQTPYHKNLKVNTLTEYVGGSLNLDENSDVTVFEGNSNDDARMDIKAYDKIMHTKIGEDKVRTKCWLIPTKEFLDFFSSKEEDSKYCLWVSVSDSGKEMNFSNRVSLLLKKGSMKKNISIVGELPNVKNTFIEHPYNSENNGNKVYFGHIEDDLMSKLYVPIKKQKQVLKGVQFGYEVYNSNTKKSFELESYIFNVTTPANGNGIQIIEQENSRGFRFSSNNDNNLVSISTEPFNSTQDDIISYVMKFGSKVRWEDWLKKNNVPSEYFNNNLKNKGYNNNWLDYARKSNNHDVYMYAIFTIEEDGELLNYKNRFKIKIDGYDENLNIETKHEYKKVSDNSILNTGVNSQGKPLGVIMDNEKTLIEITYKNKTEDFGNVYCITTIEVKNGAGEFEHEQISSIFVPLSSNPLEPIQNETKLKVERINAREIKTICLVNPAKLPKKAEFKITGRIGCLEDIEIEDARIYEKAYEKAYE